MRLPTWEEQARLWDNFYREKEAPREPTEGVLRFSRLLKKKSVVLDLGCGAGRNAIYLAKNGHIVVAQDFSKVALELCLQRATAVGVFVLPVCHHMYSLPYVANLFDSIITVGALQFGLWNEIKKCVSEMYRVAKNGALIYVAVVSNDDPRFREGCKKIEKNTVLRKNGMVMHFFDEEELRALFSNILEIKKEKYARNGGHGISWNVVVNVRK